MLIFLSTPRKAIVGVLGSLAIAYIGICVYAYMRQTRMIFFPSLQIQTTPDAFNLSYEEVWLPVGKGDTKIHGWWIPATRPESGVVLYLHGNGGNVGSNVSQANRFHQLGLSVLLIDYRGYGRSTGGFPTEANVYEDAEIAWNYLVQQRRIPPERIVIYGHSLGGAIAINLATHHPEAGGLIVQSSFTSILDLAQRTSGYQWLPLNLLLTQRFDSITKVPSLKMPTLFIHGQADVQTFPDMTEALYQATSAPKQLWLVPDAGHNNVADTAGKEYSQRVGRFIQEAIAPN